MCRFPVIECFIAIANRVQQGRCNAKWQQCEERARERCSNSQQPLRLPIRGLYIIHGLFKRSSNVVHRNVDRTVAKSLLRQQMLGNEERLWKQTLIDAPSFPRSLVNLCSRCLCISKRRLMKRKRSSTDAHPQRVQVRCADISLHIVF